MKKCPNCNLYYDDSANVCSACNGALVDANAAPQAQPAQQYEAPQYETPSYDNTSKPVTVGKWVGLLILSAIPVVNIICWIVWLCSSTTNKSIKNFLVAEIVVYAICIGVGVLVSVLLASLGVLAGSSFPDFNEMMIGMLF